MLYDTFEHEVRIEDNTHRLVPTYACLDWLKAQGWIDHRDWQIDMHSGLRGYTSFYFRDKVKATKFKLTHG